jgi:hypothetical protein
MVTLSQIAACAVGTVACVRDERGTITMRATVPTEALAILSLALIESWSI